MGLSEVSNILWRERQLLELLLFKLEEEQLLLVNGRTRWLSHAAKEIEDVLVRHDLVTDSVVVGIPDDEWGQRIAAVVVLADGASLTADELQDYCRIHLRGSKTPEIIEFRAELPRTPTGKLLRREVVADLTA